MLTPLTRKSEEILYRAIVDDYGDGPRVKYVRYTIERATLCGWWIIDGRKKTGLRWTNGKWASTTKEAALSKLKARTVAYLKQASMSAWRAQRNAYVLGIDANRYPVRGFEPADLLGDEEDDEIHF